MDAIGLLAASHAMLTRYVVSFWQLVTDALSPQEANDLAEDLGIELDTTEHIALERSALCVTTMPGKMVR